VCVPNFCGGEKPGFAEKPGFCASGICRQPQPTLFERLGIRHQHGQFVRLRFSRFVVLGLASWKQIPPAASHLLVAPLARDIRPVPDHHVKVVAHDGDRAEVDRKLSREKR